MSVRLSVVIPAFDDEPHLARTLPAVADYLRSRFGDDAEACEILVVDDGSRDGTPRLLEDLARKEPVLRRLTLPRPRGRGAALRIGLLDARGRCVLATDADLPVPIAEVERLEARTAEGFGLVCGARSAPDPGAGWLLVRGVADPRCAFKVMTRVVARSVLPEVTTDTALFDLELLLVAARKRVPVAEVPVPWTRAPGERRAGGGPRDALRAAREIARIRRAHRVLLPPRVRTQPFAGTS